MFKPERIPPLTRVNPQTDMMSDDIYLSITVNKTSLHLSKDVTHIKYHSSRD